METASKIGPGDGRKLYETLRQTPLLQDRKGRLAVESESPESLLELVDSLRMSSPFMLRSPDGPFSFLCSSSLGGAGNPTADLSCRLERARRLARFAALYADSVLIQDPFDFFATNAETDFGRQDLMCKLIVLDELRPLVEANIVSFAPTWFTFCEDHKAKFEELKTSYRTKLDEAAEVMLDEMTGHVTLLPKEGPSYLYISIKGTEQYVGKEGIDLVGLSQSLTKSISTGQPLSNETQRNLLRRNVVEPIMDDLSYRHIISSLYDVRYLTDRPVDSDILALLDHKQPPSTPHIEEALTHALPFIDGLDSETLIKLRNEEGEAFQVYRDRIQALVRQQPAGASQFEEALADLVRPALNRVDMAVQTARKIAKNEIRQKLVFGTGLVTLGLAAGTVSPELGSIVAGVGGAKFGAEILKEVSTLGTEPATARENDFYFLWRIREAARRDS